MAVMEAEMKRPRGPLPYDDMEEMPLPCQEEARSNDEYFAALGIGKAHDQRFAMQEAMQSAKMKLIQQIGDGEYTMDDIEKVCQKIHASSDGYVVYIAIRVPKSKIADKADSPLE